MVRTLERLGVSAVIIEDKKGLKRNSLFGTDASQVQDDVEDFSNKITCGKNAQVTDDFMIIARIESLILKAGMDDALTRVQAYHRCRRERHHDPQQRVKRRRDNDLLQRIRKVR